MLAVRRGVRDWSIACSAHIQRAGPFNARLATGCCPSVSGPGSRFFLTVAPNPSLLSTTTFGDGFRLPTTRGARQYSFKAKSRYRCPRHREGYLHHRPSPSRFRFRLRPFDHSQGILLSRSVEMGFLLTSVQDFMANEEGYVQLGLHCAEICKAIDRGMNGKRLDDLSQSVCEAINQLTLWVQLEAHGLGHPPMTRLIAGPLRRSRGR